MGFFDRARLQLKGGTLKRRGAPKGHPPYRPVVYTVRLHLLVTPELKWQVEAAAAAAGMKLNEWLRAAIHSKLEESHEPATS